MRPISRSVTQAGLLACLVVGIAVAAAVPTASGRPGDLPGFPEQPEIISLTPVSETNWEGEQVTHTATLATGIDPRVGVTVTFTVLQGPSVGRTFTAVTDSNGAASFTYTVPDAGLPLPTLPNGGVDQIQASFVLGHDTIGSNWAGQGWSQAAVGQNVPGHPPALVKTPGETSFADANDTQQLPPGTQVDVTGRRAISVLNFYGRRMLFLGVPDEVPSQFVLVNGLRSPGKPINIKLIGGKFNRCKARSPQARTPQVSSSYSKGKGKPVRRLWGSGKGRYVTTGKFASATITGTVWLIADYCDGTLVKVRSGVVHVRDLVTGKTVVLKSGHAYFAKSS